MLRASGSTGFCTVTPRTSDLTIRLTLTLGPGVALDTSIDATTLLDVTELMVSARPVTVTVVLVGGLITISPAGPAPMMSMFLVNVLDVGGF